MYEHQIRQLKAERLECLCQRAGFALWQLQSLEMSSAQSFVLMAKAKRGMGEEAGKKLLEPALKRTFGRSVHSMRRQGLISGALEKRFDHILKERNWLIHRSRTESEHALCDKKAFVALYERIDKIAEESNALINLLAEMSIEFTVSAGITKEKIDTESTELLNKWRQHAEML